MFSVFPLFWIFCVHSPFVSTSFHILVNCSFLQVHCIVKMSFFNYTPTHTEGNRRILCLTWFFATIKVSVFSTGNVPEEERENRTTILFIERTEFLEVMDNWSISIIQQMPIKHLLYVRHTMINTTDMGIYKLVNKLVNKQCFALKEMN